MRKSHFWVLLLPAVVGGQPSEPTSPAGLTGVYRGYDFTGRGVELAMSRFEKDRTKGHVWLYFFVPKTFDLQTGTLKLGDSTVKLKN